VSQHFVPALAGRTLRCILFDLGATLWTYKENASLPAQKQAVQQQVLTILHRHVNPQNFPSVDEVTLGKQIAEAIDKRIYEMYLLNVDIEPDFAQGVVEALQQLGFPPLDREVGAEIFEASRRRSFEGRVLFEGALSTLAELKRRGFLLGVVTNRSYGGPLFLKEMEKIGLLDYFEERNVAISVDLGIRKPNAKIFMYTLDALNVSPEEAVMVGDSLGADVVGAKKLNMVAVWKPNPRVFAQIKEEQGQEELSQQVLRQRLFELSRLREQKRGRPIPEDIMPDLIIEHLGELLDVFREVGQY
jgi:HAD superfamily hydrolase (TIGR01509 family)